MIWFGHLDECVWHTGRFIGSPYGIWRTCDVRECLMVFNNENEMKTNFGAIRNNLNNKCT